MYPAVATVHAALDALRSLRAENGFGVADITGIRVGLIDWAVQHGASITRPTDAISAQFSLAFSIGLLLTRGRNLPQDYLNPQLWTDPEILAAGDKVIPYAYPFEAGTPDLSAKVDVELADGRVLSFFQSGFRGHTTHPSTMEGILAKYTDLTDGIVPKETATAIVDLVRQLQDVDDITSLTRLLATPVQA
jgi:2-methylcitrate dehydratase PrpD